MSEPLSNLEFQRMLTVIDKAEAKRGGSISFLTEEMRRMADELSSYRNGGSYQDGYDDGHEEGYEEGKSDGRDEMKAEMEDEDDEDAELRPLALGR